MKRFRFRFDAVKQQREAILDEKRTLLAEALSKEQLARDLLERCEQALNQQASLNPKPGQLLDLGQELQRQRYLSALREERVRRQQIVEKVSAETASARQAVTVAHQGLEAMKKLEERDREAWALELKRSEERESDEQNAQRFERR